MNERFFVLSELKGLDEPCTPEEKTGKVPYIWEWKEIDFQKTKVQIPYIITYGLYPQSHVDDSDLISRLEKYAFIDETGWYFLDGEYYAKKTVDPKNLV